MLAPQSSIMGEIMLIGLTADTTSQMDLRTIADRNIRPRLLATGGVSQVIIIGGEFKQYQIFASPQKMKYYKISLDELLEACEQSTLNSAGGFLNEYGNKYIIRGIGRTNKANDIGNSVIKVIDDRPIKIEDVAAIKIGGAIPKIGNKIENILLSLPEISLTSRRTGRAELDEHAFGENTSEIEFPFKLQERSHEEFMKDVRKKLSAVSEANITIGQPIGHRIDHMLSGTRANIAIKLFGSNLNKMFHLANQIKSNIKSIDGLVDINVSQQIEIPQIQIKAKRDMLAKYGISIGQFTEFIDIAFAGEKVSQVFESNKSFDLVLRFNNENRNNLESIKNVLIDTHDGKKGPLNYLANILSTTGPNTINRENVQRKVVISANVAGRDLRGVVNEVKEEVNSNIQLPEGYHIQYGGQFESEEKASRILLFTSLMSLLVIFLLLYQEFKDLKIAAIILINLPLALIGGGLSIWFTSGIISIPSIIGFITLFGITIPLWESKNTVKFRKAQVLFNQMQVEDHKNQHIHEIQQLYDKYQTLSITLKEYVQFLNSIGNIKLLDKALSLGEISSIQYFMEMSYYYDSYDKYLQLEKE